MIKKFLHSFRYFLLGNLREVRLSKHFSEIIIKYKSSNNLNILDYGSGFHPSVIVYTSKILNENEIVANISCMDFYNEEELEKLNKLYRHINFSHLTNVENKKFDFIIISDVLHHIGIDKIEEIKILLAKLSKLTDFVLIKDHFEYGFVSRTLLRFMDFIGNYKDGVSIPKSYFNKKSLSSLMNDLELEKVHDVKKVSLYKNIYFPFSLKKFQFIHLYKR